MGRHREARPRRHASALISLVAFPLAFGTVTAHLVGPVAEEGPASSSPATVPFDDLLVTPPRPDTAPAVAASSRSSADGRVGTLPWTALQSYQRAAGILAEVRPECGLPWTLLAAVGEVESGHGQDGGGELTDEATVRPALRGPALDGRGGRPKVPDTDRGGLDGDAAWDRELGPMRLAPAVWKLAGVDGDGDGSRDVQDLDDAALATAVYLCASGEGLHKPANAAAALLEYRGDEAYVQRVMAAEERYRQGRYSVSARPPMSTASASLDLGPGAPVRDLTARAVGDVTLQLGDLGGLGGIPLTERTSPAGGAVVTAGRPPRTRSPEAGATTAPPRTGAPATGPGPADDPTDEPTRVPSERPTGPTPPVDPGLPSDGTDGPGDPVTEPAPGPTDGPPAGPPAETPAETPVEPPPTGGRPSDEPTGEEPAPSDDPTTALVEGVWTACARTGAAVGGYCLDDALLELALVGPLDAPATEDLDGDGTVATVGEELEGLLGRIVTLTVVAGTEPLAVLAVSPGAMAPR